MIVFPLIRSVGLKAATASSRVETLPMFVRSRPSRNRWTSSLNWARSGTTTKSIVRPPVGRASVGPAMVTSVPPARITPADRFAMSPPRTSKTRSTSPTSFRASLSRSTNSCCAEVESRLTAASAPGADDVRAGRTVHKDALPHTKATVLEQPLPRGQVRHHEGRAHREIDVAPQRREVACLDGYILRQRAVASPVREAEHSLSHRQPRCSIAEGGDHSRQLVAGDRRRPITAEAVDPGRGPRQLIPGESRRMNLSNDIAVVRAREAGERRPLRLGPLHQLHPSGSRSLIRHHNRLHPAPPSMSAITKLDNELPHSKLLVHKQPAVTSPPQQQPLQVGRGRFTLRPVRLQGFDPLLVVSVLNYVHKFLVRDRSGITQPLSNLESSPTSWPHRCLQAGKRESHARRN